MLKIKENTTENNNVTAVFTFINQVYYAEISMIYQCHNN